MGILRCAGRSRTWRLFRLIPPRNAHFSQNPNDPSSVLADCVRPFSTGRKLVFPTNCNEFGIVSSFFFSILPEHKSVKGLGKLLHTQGGDDLGKTERENDEKQEEQGYGGGASTAVAETIKAIRKKRSPRPKKSQSDKLESSDENAADNKVAVLDSANENETELERSIEMAEESEKLEDKLKREETMKDKRKKAKCAKPAVTDWETFFKAVDDGVDVFQDQVKPEGQPAVPTIKMSIPHDLSDPNKVYQMMCHANPAEANLTHEEKEGLIAILQRFTTRGWATDQALALYINSKSFPHAAATFKKFFIPRCPPKVRQVLLSVGPSDESEEYIFPIFAEFCINEFSSEITRFRELVISADLTKPHAWFPFARAIKRKIIYHCGPTNSGKTYNALQRFLASRNGIYCCPLRLLATEIYEKANSEGVYCSLHTGQERREVPFATHLACTVEMAIMNKPYEVAVIDEVQMTNDEYRGWAWTRAFLSVQADEVHLCGDPSTLKLMKALCEATGDDFEERHYERFKPLKIENKSLYGEFSNILPGDCVVAFSRKEIFLVKQEIELRSKQKCCVVYGALPPETRTQQAKLFNDPKSGYDVLVASDAIGMGLNLNIRRVIFYSIDKFNGEQKIQIPPSQLKQIAGRAGRHGSLYPDGMVTTAHAHDLDYLVDCLEQPFEEAQSAGLFPVFEQMELFASQLPDISFGQLLDRFSETCKLDGTYFLCRHDNLKKVAGVLDKIQGLSLQDRFYFCFAPVNTRDPRSMGTLQRFASAYSRNIPVRLSMGVPSRFAKDNKELCDLETRHQLLSMYLWLSQHFPGDAFPERDQAAEMATKVAELLGESLVHFTGRTYKPELRRRNSMPRTFQRPVEQSLISYLTPA